MHRLSYILLAVIGCTVPTGPGADVGAVAGKRCCEISLLVNRAGEVTTQYGHPVYGVEALRINGDGTITLTVRTDTVTNK